MSPELQADGLTSEPSGKPIEQTEDTVGNKVDLYHQRQIFLETANLRKDWLINSIEDSLPFCSYYHLKHNVGFVRSICKVLLKVYQV